MGTGGVALGVARPQDRILLLEILALRAEYEENRDRIAEQKRREQETRKLRRMLQQKTTPDSLVDLLVSLRKRGWSYAEVANWLNLNGVTTLRGKQWSRENVFRHLKYRGLS